MCTTQNAPWKSRHAAGLELGIGRQSLTASERTGNDLKVSSFFTWKPSPESGLDCLMCAMFSRQRFVRTPIRSRAAKLMPTICHKWSGSTKITTRLHHIGHCKTTSGTNWSNRWTYWVIIINTRRDQIASRSLLPSNITVRGRAWHMFLDVPVLTLDVTV